MSRFSLVTAIRESLRDNQSQPPYDWGVKWWQVKSKCQIISPVKDLAVKPVSRFTMQRVSLHAFYVATLTQAAPVRLLCHLAGMAEKAVRPPPAGSRSCWRYLDCHAWCASIKGWRCAFTV